MTTERRRHEVILAGLPPNSTKKDIIIFFCDIDIGEQDIRYVNNSARDGTKEVGSTETVFQGCSTSLIRPSLSIQVCISLMDGDDVAKALEMNGCLFGKKFGQCRVRVCSSNEAEKADSSTLTQIKTKESNTGHIAIEKSIQTSPRRNEGEMEYGNIVVIDGMPLAMSKEDVQYLLWGTHVSLRDIRLVHQDRNPYILVQFRNEEIARNVVKRWNGTTITTKSGSHTVRLRIPAEIKRGDPINDDVESNILKMMQIPAKTTPHDIAEFFEGFSVKAKGIHLQVNQNFSQTATAYIEFEGIEAAEKALKRDKCSLSGRFRDKCCRLFMIPRIEMELEILRNSHAREFHARRGPRFDKSMIMQQMFNPYNIYHGRSFLDTRMFLPGATHRPCLRPSTGPRGSGSDNRSINSSHSDLSDQSNAPRYYVKDLETGKFLYLDQGFAPAAIPSDQNRNGNNKGDSKSGFVKYSRDTSNVSSESESTLLNVRRNQDACNGG